MTEPIQEIQLKDLFDHATDLIHFASPEGKILYVNESWRHTLGYQPEEVHGQSIYSFVVPWERDKFRNFREMVLAGRLPSSHVETKFLTKEGTEIHIDGYIGCKYDRESPLYTHAILRDVTKKIKEQQALLAVNEQIREREENFQQLISSAPDAVIVIDSESRIILWNRKSEEIFGWKSEEVTGTLLAEAIIPEQYRERHYNGMKRYLTTGEIHVLNKTIEITALKKTGEEFYVALTISSAMNKGQMIFIAFLRDISEQKKMEQELKMQKQKLEASNEELAQYASLASHDLKEPVRKILTFSDMLLRSRGTDSKKFSSEELVKKISKTAQRMKDVIESISRFSSISQTLTEKIPVDIKTVLDDLLTDFQDDIEAKKATLFISTLPPVGVSVVHLYQLFENLISNSLKYSRPGIPPVIDIRGRIADEKFCEILFQDNGIGFESRFAKKVFEPFQRLHGSDYEGTGIGLAICKKIVEGYSGKITVESEPDKGSTFIFTLPLQY